MTDAFTPKMEVLMNTASNKSAPEQQPLMISVTHHPSQHLEAPPAPVERQVQAWEVPLALVERPVQVVPQVQEAKPVQEVPPVPAERQVQEVPPVLVERPVLVDLLELPCLEAAPVQEHLREAQHQEAPPAKDQQWTPSPKLMLPIRPLLPKMQKLELLLKTRMLPTLPQLQLTV